MKNEKSLPLTEFRFRELLSQLPNCCEKYVFGKKNTIYTCNIGCDNKFSLSYHLSFPQIGVKFNFWFDKISFMNSKEVATVSFYNKNEILEKNRLKNILKTSCSNELKTLLNNILSKH